MPPEVDSEEVPEVEVESTESDELPDPPAAAEAEDSGDSQPAAPQGTAWDAFRQIPQFQGKADEEIAMGLYQALQREQQYRHQIQQYQSIVPVASEYLTNRDLYEQWKQGRMAPQAAAPQAGPQAAPAQQPAAPAEESWWNPPKIKDSYRQYLTKDEQGREVISPDAPLDARAALAEYQAYRADFAKKFLENPEETLMPMVARVAEQRAQELIESQLQRRDEESFVRQVEEENADWLRDENGRASREALLAQRYIEDAKRYGIQGAKPRWEFAKKMVEYDLLLNFYQQASQSQQPQQAQQAEPAQQPQPSVDQKNMEYLRQQAMRNPSRSSPGTAGPRVPPQQQLSFAEKLQQQLASEGLI